MWHWETANHLGRQAISVSQGRGVESPHLSSAYSPHRSTSNRGACPQSRSSRRAQGEVCSPSGPQARGRVSYAAGVELSRPCSGS